MTDNHKARVGVSGHGVIGKRVADAVALQADVELVGISDVVADWRTHTAHEKGHPIFAVTRNAAQTLRAESIPVAVARRKTPRRHR